MPAYIINYTDPRQPSFIVNPYTTNGLRFPLSDALAQGASSAKTSLMWYGKGSPNYGERIYENFLHILENFAGATVPSNPVSGQLWFDRRLFFHDGAVGNGSGWYVWEDDPADSNGGDWTSVSVATGSGAPAGVIIPNFYVDTNESPVVFYERVVVTDHPIENQWIVRGYAEFSTSGAPNANTIKPQQRLMVQTIARTAQADSSNWTPVSDVWASPVPPVDPKNGTLWYDTTVPAAAVFKVYDEDSMSFVSVDSGANALSELTDVDISSPVTGEVLRFNGVIWVNAALTAADLGDVTASATEINYLNGVTDNIQDQLNDKVARSGDAMTGILSMGNNRITNVGTPISNTDAATKQYVDQNERFLVSAVYDSGTGTLVLTLNDTSTIEAEGFTSGADVYTTQADEVLDNLPVLPTTLDEAIHDLDKSLRRRTTFGRSVAAGTGASTYDTPAYVVGSNKLFVFVDGLKFRGSTFGYQRVLFTLDPLGSPVTPQQLGCSTSGLSTGSPLVTYAFSVSVDGGGAQEILIEDADSFCDVIDQINAQLTGAVAVLEDSAIIIYSDTTGASSSIDITDGPVGSPSPESDLFASLLYFDSIETPVDGADLQYDEVGTFGTVSTQVTFNVSVNTQDLEFISCGRSEIPL